MHAPVRTFLSYFVYTNLFMVACALLMTQQTVDLFQLRLSHSSLLPFIASATLCSYSLHWYLTPVHPSPSPRIAWKGAHGNLLFQLFATGLLGSMLFLLPLLEHAGPIAVAIAASFLYTAPKLQVPALQFLSRIQVAKTFFLAFTWMYVTTLLPMLVDEEPIRAPHAWFCASRFFLIYAICILFDHRDQEEDRQLGIRSLPTLFNRRQVTLLFFFTLAAFFACTIQLHGFLPDRVSLFALILPGTLAALLFRRALSDHSDILYYVVLDGLMALSSIITIFLPF
jgi:4-hydroxybenzoate polyprenyltransferase